MGLYNVITVRFDVTSTDFKSVMLFIRKIEKSNFPIKIDDWVGHEGDGGKISFTMNISAVLIHP